MRILRVNDRYVVIEDDDDPLLVFGRFEDKFSEAERYDIITKYADSVLSDNSQKKGSIMTDQEILDSLWEAFGESPFAYFLVEGKLDLRHPEYCDTLNLLFDMAEHFEIRHGYRIKRVSSKAYQLSRE